MYIAASRQGRVNRCKFRGVYIGRDRCNIIPFFTSTIMSRSKFSEKLLLLKLRATEDAEDITSEVFLKAWRYINEKKKIESFSGLLYRLARNCVIDLYRFRSKQKETLSVDAEIGIEIGDAGKWKENLGEDLENKVEMQKVVEALQRMKQEYREAVALRYVDELEISEIAEITGKGHIAVRVTLH